MILVTGATGAIGRPLVDLLLTEGATVRAVTRQPLTAALPAAVELVGGDPSRPDTILAALDGVTGLFLHPRAVGMVMELLNVVYREEQAAQPRGVPDPARQDNRGKECR